MEVQKGAGRCREVKGAGSSREVQGGYVRCREVQGGAGRCRGCRGVQGCGEKGVGGRLGLDVIVPTIHPYISISQPGETIKDHKWGAITTGNANQLIPAYLCLYVLCIHTVMKCESM